MTSTDNKNLSNVAHVFASYYYNTLHENPAKLASLYTATAQLSHSKIPDADGVNFINKSLETQTCSSLSEIKQFYDACGLAECKIRITSIDQQPTPFTGSMMISTMGEINLNGKAAVYRFQQSFILVHSRDNVYDVTNDIFRLIPDEEYELETQSDDTAVPESLVQDDTEEETAEAAISVDDLPNKVNDEPKIVAAPMKSDEPSEKTAEVNDSEIKAIPSKPVEESKESKEDVLTETKAVKAPKPDKKEKKEEQKEQKVEAQPMEKEKTPSKPSSWAQAVSTATVDSKIKSTKAVKSPSPTNVSASTPAGDAPAASQTVPPKNATSQQQAQPQQQPVQGSFGNRIKVGQTNNVENQDLKMALETEFGRTAKVEPRGNFALVSFETESAQRKALGKKLMKVKNNTVTLEVMPESLYFKSANKQQSGHKQKSKRPSTDKKKK